MNPMNPNEDFQYLTDKELENLGAWGSVDYYNAKEEFGKEVCEINC